MGVPTASAEHVSASSPSLRLVDSGRPTLADIYRDHADFVVRVARRLGVEAGQAEDIVHDVFLVVHRRLTDFDGRGSLRSWLYGITKRVVMHHHRGRARTARREARGPAPVPAPDPEEGLERARAGQWIEQFMQSLDEPQRLVFALSDVEGMSAPEIADALEVKLNTVYSRLRLARRRFERALAQRSTTKQGGAT